MKPVKSVICTILFGMMCANFVTAAEPMRLDEAEFQQKFRSFKNERNETERHRRFSEMARTYRLTSQQVKTIAQNLRNDDARLEFATAAFPRTLDPENFYEVYDAFETFSKVMRLHDRVRPLDRPHPPVMHLPPVLPEEELGPILNSLRKESFDNGRVQLARQIFTSSRRLFLASQIKRIVDLFDFEQNKLETAKLAYEFTFDRDKYFLVNDAFSFEGSKTALARHIEEWNKKGAKKD